jgi:hypothetical protein
MGLVLLPILYDRFALPPASARQDEGRRAENVEPSVAAMAAAHRAAEANAPMQPTATNDAGAPRGRRERQAAH